MRDAPAMLNINPYLSNLHKSIIYNVSQTADGWTIEVIMPPRIPASDRIKVLEWLRQYRTQIRLLYPMWSTVLHPSVNRYQLEIRKTNSDKELIEAGEQLKSICGEILEYA
jgi:MOSC domain-containing protein YiiM